MKLKSYHISNFGSFAPSIATRDGFIIYHDSPRYAKASAEQLDSWAESKTKAVSNAAITEQAERNIRAWRNGNS